MAPRRKFDLEFKERVLRYAEENSGEKTARHFNIDSKRIRYWRKQKEELLSADRGRARLTGGGRKKVSLELESRLSEWICSMRVKHHRVSRNMIKKKALEIYPSVSDGGKAFVASTGWLQKFLRRNSLSLQLPVSRRQDGTQILTENLVSFVDHVSRAVRSQGISEKDIIAMDETALCFDIVYPPAGETSREDGEARRPRRPRESHLTVVLAAKADGTRLAPYVVFRGAADEVKAMQQQNSSVIITTSANGLMTDALTADWLQSVVGKFNSTPRLLVWDSYRCHISDATKAELKRGYNMTTAVIPAGCPKYIQAADVMWNRVFKQSLQDSYDRWAAGDADKEYTAEGYLKVPARRLLVDWVLRAWNKLDEDLIRKSFKVCGLSVRADGSEDDLILCFREGEACCAGRETLARLRRRRGQEDGAEATQHDQIFNNELLVVEDEEASDDGAEGGDQW